MGRCHALTEFEERRIVYASGTLNRILGKITEAYINRNLKELVTSRICLHEISGGFAVLRHGKTIRTVIQL